MTPVVAKAVGVILSKFATRREESTSEVLQLAADMAGVPVDEVARRAVADERTLELAGEAIWAAWQTLNADKIRGLARALANGLTAEERIDQERLVIAALSDMEAVHIKVLDFMDQPNRYRAHRSSSWQVGELTAELPGLQAAFRPVLAVLERHYLVKLVENWAAVEDKDRGDWILTSFGRVCLEHLRQRPDAPL